MPKGNLCVEPRVGKRIKEYNKNAPLRPDAKGLSFEENLMLEAHLIRCPYCRKRLSLEAQLNFETMLILSGYFLEDPILIEKRRSMVRRFFLNELSFEEFKGDWLGVSEEERGKLKAFMKEDC